MLSVALEPVIRQAGQTLRHKGTIVEELPCLVKRSPFDRHECATDATLALDCIVEHATIYRRTYR